MLTEIIFNSQKQRWTKRRITVFLHSGLLLILMSFFMGGCATTPVPTPEESAKKFIEEQTKGATDGIAKPNKPAPELNQTQLPVRYQKLSYNLGESSYSKALEGDSIPVGADYTPKGPMQLRKILSLLTNLKKISISWASDVNKDALVHVPTIRATDDFFEVIDNILRQNDYSYEVQGHTLIIKYKETKKFHIAMPFLSSKYTTSVGGDVLGSTEGSNMSGTLNINSSDNGFDIWGNIQTNIDKILEIWAAPAATPAPTASTTTDSTSDSAKKDESASTATAAAPAAMPPTGKGYYTIDKPIGLITVTAPRSLLEKVESYIENLKSELYRQVSIEAKILEVTLTDDNTTGINWAELFSQTFNFALDLSRTDLFKPSGTQNPSVLGIGTNNFAVVIDAMKQQGHIEVLSNPKISVMNGQPAMISVGENVTYVDSVSSTTEDGVVSFTINTASVMSGLGLGVIASIVGDDEVILNITPVTSDLSQPVQYLTFGTNQVGIPKVKLKELNTVVRVKNGEMLIIGGLIDNSATYNDNYVSGLGEIPGVKEAFRVDGTNTAKKELIILMRPRIHSL